MVKQVHPKHKELVKFLDDITEKVDTFKLPEINESNFDNYVQEQGFEKFGVIPNTYLALGELVDDRTFDEILEKTGDRDTLLIGNSFMIVSEHGDFSPTVKERIELSPQGDRIRLRIKLNGYNKGFDHYDGIDPIFPSEYTPELMDNMRKNKIRHCSIKSKVTNDIVPNSGKIEILCNATKTLRSQKQIIPTIKSLRTELVNKLQTIEQNKLKLTENYQKLIK